MQGPNVLSHMGGARAYIPRAIREKKYVNVLARKAQKIPTDTPSWVADIFSSGGQAPEPTSSPAAAAPAAAAAAGSGQPGRQQQGSQQTHRFSKSESQAARRVSEAEQREAARLEREGERAGKLKVRAAQRAVVRLKTSKGQPRLGARMKGLLSKVERMVGR